MDPTAAQVAVVGIVATLLAALLSPAVSERMRRRSAREIRLLESRLEVYAELLQAAFRVNDNVQTWAVDPKADLEEHDDAFLDQMLARLHVLASKEVYEEALAWKSRVYAFHHARALYLPMSEHDHAKRGQAGLMERADEISERVRRLVSLVRRETAA